MARSANHLYTYRDLRNEVASQGVLQRYAFSENDDTCVNKANTLTRVYVYPDNLPNDRMPTWDDLVAISPVTINWSNTELTSPFIDCNLFILLNGVAVVESFVNETGSVSGFEGARWGDEVTIILYTATGYPWPVDGRGHLRLYADSSLVYSEDTPTWVDNGNALLHAFTVEDGVNYSVVCYTDRAPVFICSTGWHTMDTIDNATGICQATVSVGTISGNIVIEYQQYSYYDINVIYEGSIIYTYSSSSGSGTINFDWYYNTEDFIIIRYL